VAPLASLGKNHLPVHGDIEHSPRRLHQRDFGVGKFPADLRRQTGGAGLIVSDHAIMDQHAHGISLPWIGIR
jgi:hypothetical protein